MATRMYTLFVVNRENGKPRYTQTDKPALPKNTAVRVYQGQLLNCFLTGGTEYCLRPVQKIPDMHQEVAK
jgi:hypothetical protein